MTNENLYKDILTLLFGNEQNRLYFQKYYGENELFQRLLRDYLKIRLETQNIKLKIRMPACSTS